ncbi:tetratricopeptide repeat-containing sensor histidine kinase [Flavobacterium sp.]|uniref:tetratricopeptide repeat-containing sensor histidine kinase n=3 Tax=Flavobacterium sp. TaxID=239 RepID=UPI004047EF7F
MRIGICLFVFFSAFISGYSQKSNNQEFDLVKERVSKTFFVKPLEALDDAYVLKKIAKTDLQIVTAYKYLGYIYDLTGNSDSARFYFTNELYFAKKNFYKDEIHYQAVINYCNWGLNYVDGKVIVKELTEALDIIDQNKNAQQKGLMYMLLGDVLLKDFEYDKAENYFDKSFKLIKGKYVKVDYYVRKAEVNILKSNYKKANSNLLLAVKSLDTKDIFTYPLILNKLGDVSMMLGDFTAAKKYLEESLFYQNKNSFRGMSSETYLNLYRLEKKTKSKFDKYFLEKALESHSGDLTVLKKIYLEFKEYYSIQKDILQEIVYLRKFNQINDSIFNIEKVKVKADIESRYQLNENLKELSLKEKIIQEDKTIKKSYLFALGLLLLIIVLILIFYYTHLKAQKQLRKNQKMLHEEQLKLMLENQRMEIIKEKIKTKFEERGKLSLELHDGIASEISALKLSLATESELSKLEIDNLVEKIDKLYTEIRNLSHSLDPDNIDFVEFSQFVANLCNQLEKRGLKTSRNFYITKKVDDLEVDTLVNVYRIIQEAVTNVIKHANAKNVDFDVIETDDTLYIYIKDDGIGFDVKESKQGIGIKNIKKRVNSFQGNVQILSKKEVGTEIKINLPII